MSNFRPDTGGRRWSLVQVRLFSPAVGREGTADKCPWRVWGVLAVIRPHWVCPHSLRVCFPVYTAQAPGCSTESGPCVGCGSSFRVLHKSADPVGPAFCAFPGPSSSGTQELEERILPGCDEPSPLRGPSLSFCARRLGVPCVCSGELVSSRDPPGRYLSTIQNLRKSLVRNWKPVCSVVGDAVSRRSLPLSPPPCLLPPAGDGPVRSWLALLWNCSVLSLFCERAGSVFS